MRTAPFTEGLSSMAEFIPAWLGKALGGKNDESLPSWLSLALEEKRASFETVDMPAETETRAMNKGSGDFTQRMMTEIRSHESPNHGYTDYFGRGFTRGPVAPPKDLNLMTVREVSDWQIAANPPGNDTAAAGAYQIINKTLNGLIGSMGLTGDELFDEALQDRMAISLMKGRGLDKFLAGTLDGDSFANKMAREWASLPVLKEDRRGRRTISIGQSYYTGDGVNKAFEGTQQLSEYKELYALADIGG